MKKNKLIYFFVLCLCAVLSFSSIQAQAASRVPNIKVLKITEFFNNGQSGFKIKIKNSSNYPVKITEFALSELSCGYWEEIEAVSTGGAISNIYRLNKAVNIPAGATKTITWKAPSYFGKFNPFDAGNVDCSKNINIDNLIDEFEVTHGSFYSTDIDIFSTYRGKKCVTSFDACKTKNLEKLRNELFDGSDLYYEYTFLVDYYPDSIVNYSNN